MTETETTGLELPSSKNDDGLDDGLIYHYTNAQGLMGIIKNKNIWATHFKYLNDATELMHGMELFDESLNKILEKQKESSDKKPSDEENTHEEKEFESSVNEKWPDFDKEKTAKKVLENYLSKEDFFIASFSKKPDLLSQWRGYTPKGGYAIGFKEKALLKEDVLEEVKWRLWMYCGLNQEQFVVNSLQCNYKEKKDVLPENYFPNIEEYSDFYKVLEYFGMTNDPETIEMIKASGISITEDLAETYKDRFENDYMKWFTRKILPVLLKAKHPGFEEEKEHRIVVKQLSDEAKQLSDEAKQHIYPEQPMPDVKFRVSNNAQVLIPYIELPLSQADKPIDVIENIMIGPCRDPQEAKNALAKFLKAEGLGHVNIENSCIPYRPMA